MPLCEGTGLCNTVHALPLHRGSQQGDCASDLDDDGAAQLGFDVLLDDPEHLDPAADRRVRGRSCTPPVIAGPCCSCAREAVAEQVERDVHARGPVGADAAGGLRRHADRLPLVGHVRLAMTESNRSAAAFGLLRARRRR
jgi:hypothetical protein